MGHQRRGVSGSYFLSHNRHAVNQAADLKWNDGELYPADLPEPLRFQLYNTERVTVHLANEVVSVFDTNGTRLLQKEGGPKAVSLTRAERSGLVGTVVTHNHPSVATPSIDDFLMAFDCRVLEMRAIDSQWIYRLRSPEGWPVYKRAFLVPILAPNLVLARFGGIRDVQEINHKAWSTTAAALGLEYRRLPWSPPVVPIAADDMQPAPEPNAAQ